mgnify:CR=1 FL=1
MALNFRQQGEIYRYVDEKIARLIIEHPQVGKIIEGKREKLMNLCDRFLTDTMPHDDEMLSGYCKGVDLILDSAISFESDRHVVNAVRSQTLETVKSVLEDDRRFSWKSPVSSMKNVRNAVCYSLKLPFNAPPKDSDEWHVCREKILGLRTTGIRNCGLAGLFNRYDEYKDVLISAFGADYDIRLEDFNVPSKKPIKASYPLALASIVRKTIFRNLNLMADVPEKNSPEWHRRKNIILSVRSRDLRMWGGPGHRVNPYGSDQGLMIAAFGEEYDLRRSDFPHVLNKKVDKKRIHEEDPEILSVPLPQYIDEHREVFLDLIRTNYLFKFQYEGKQCGAVVVREGTVYRSLKKILKVKGLKDLKDDQNIICIFTFPNEDITAVNFNSVNLKNKRIQLLDVRLVSVDDLI